jgi:peroxiredoxin
MLALRICLALLSGASLFAAGELSNRRAPSFALPDSQMKYHDLLDYRGKVVIVDISLTGCPNCQKLAGTLEKVKAKYGDRIQILTIVNPPDNMVSVTQFIKQHKITSPILFDCGQVSVSYFKATPDKPSVHVPHVFLIDQNGWIRNDFAHSPATEAIFSGTALFKEIDALLAPSPKK